MMVSDNFQIDRKRLESVLKIGRDKIFTDSVRSFTIFLFYKMVGF